MDGKKRNRRIGPWKRGGGEVIRMLLRSTTKEEWLS